MQQELRPAAAAAAAGEDGTAGRRSFAGFDLRRPKGYPPAGGEPAAEAEAEAAAAACPRCASTNTKFCYYNNYNTSQPRHFCKSCRRYWTKGGTLRNVPVGGGSRKSATKRSSRPKSSTSSSKRRRAADGSAWNSDSSSTFPAAAAAATDVANPNSSSLEAFASEQPMFPETHGSFTSLIQSDPAALGLGFSDPASIDQKVEAPEPAFEWPAAVDTNLFDLGSYWNQNQFVDTDPALFLNLP